MIKHGLQRALRPAVLLQRTAAHGNICKPLTVPHVQNCLLGTRSGKEKLEPLISPKGARDFIYSLNPKERTCLLKELQSFESMAIAQASENSGCTREQDSTGDSVSPESKDLSSWQSMDRQEKLESSPPTTAQLRYVLLHNAIPFIGFGFLDNAIMIAAGTQIELSIGVTFGISTMAAAAMGNLVSDLAGLGLAGYVEALAARLGLQIPDLTPKQADMRQTRLSAHMGKAIGITIGCILGMFPLLFLSDEEEKKVKETELPTSTDPKSS